VTKNNNFEERVLVCMPTGRDGLLVCSTLSRAGVFSYAVENCQDLGREIRAGVGAVLIAEEALLEGAVEQLQETLKEQPVWSDLPVIVFAAGSSGAEKLVNSLGSRFNATVVERPIRITLLVSAVRGALRARERQYQTRDLLEQLEEADKQKDLFLATLSHELRTPLNSMLGWIQILRSQADHIDVEHALDVIERNAKSQSEMISDILFVSRIITGKLELELEPIRVSEIVQRVIDVIGPTAAAKDITLNFENRKEVIYIDADPERLSQVFLNLLSNAVKFTSEGGRIDVVVERQGSNIEIEIRDNGQGIGAEFLPYIFERFRQADNTYTRRTGGLGLGLAIVRHLVELHGGTVHAKSSGVGRGSSFVVSLPIALKEQENEGWLRMSARRQPQNGRGYSLKDITIVLVEDDPDSSDMLVTVLTHQGATVVTASSAQEGLEKVRLAKPDILISDVGLPQEDGYDLIRKVRQLPPGEGGAVPAIALTGYVSHQDRSAAIAAGFQEHVPKPLDVEYLIESIARLAAPRIESSHPAGAQD
jgi:signal transduction histidine kinase/ActR/RegA family two-component response regulator